MHCGGGHLKRNCPKRAEEKEKTKKDDCGEWQARGAEDKRADRKTEVKGRQFHIMFTLLLDHTSRTDFSDLGEGKKFTWHQFHVKVWGAQNFEGHTPVAMHNTTGYALPLTWIPLDSQSTVDLIVNKKVLVSISNVQGEDAIIVHFNSGFKIVNKFDNLLGYGTVWYKPTGIAKIISISRTTNKFLVVFDSNGGDC